MKDALGDRMKRYESTTKTHIPHRQPTIIRVDGKAFHTYTRNLSKPWSIDFGWAMDSVAFALCQNVQNVQLAYIQSDEISLLLHPYKRYKTQAWFDGEVQKMVSVSAAIAAARMTMASKDVFGEHREAYFDSRVFVLPSETEATNYFIWRQQDAVRNSIQMLARSLYSHKECDKKNSSELQEMCWQKGKNWNDVGSYWKRGRCIVKLPERWMLDPDIPTFSEHPEYITSRLALEAEDAEAAE
jgi:tRNA(His) guanylyltransferase